MSRLNNILEDTLKEIGVIKPQTLGSNKRLSPEKDDVKFSVEAKNRLLLRLEKEGKFNNKMIVVMFISHFLVFALAVFLVIYFLKTPEVIVYLFGGSIFSIMVINYSLIHIWKAKIANDNLRTILPDLPPNQAVELIKNIYSKADKEKPKKAE
jgi:hypothetical protein